MFSRLIFGKKGEPATLEVFLDHLIYEKFRAYIVQNRLDESSALVKILKLGMSNYWLHEFKHTKISHLQLKKLFEEYKKDNELLNALQRENNQLKCILEKSKLEGLKNEDQEKFHAR